jgi:hypothetical protein
VPSRPREYRRARLEQPLEEAALCFDGTLVATAASSGRRPRVKHRNNQQQNTKDE